MKIVDLISRLREADIKLRLEGDQLKVNAPKGALTEEWRALLMENKAEVIAFLSMNPTGAAVDQSYEIAPIPRDQNLPLGFTQLNLWYLDRLYPGNVAYNIPAGFTLKGKLGKGLLEQSIRLIIRRHEMLRTTFDVRDGETVQIISEHDSLELSWVDLRRLPNRLNLSKDLWIQEGRHSFDLKTGPLFRCIVHHLDESSYALLLVMHHTIADGWSMGVFLNELMIIYEALAGGRYPSLPELPIQFADFAHWQRSSMKGELLEKRLGYWRRQLADCNTVLELPTDKVRPQKQNYDGHMLPLTIPDSTKDRLFNLAREEGVTPFILLLSIYGVLLHRYSHQEDITIGTPVANRSRVDLENLIGCFINSLVLRMDFSGKPDFRELLMRTRKMTLEAFSHQEVPFERLVEALSPEREASRNPIFQNMFLLQSNTLDNLECSDFSLEPELLDIGITHFDVSLSLTERNNRLQGYLEYNTALYEQATMARFLRHYLQLVNSVLDAPHLAIAALPLLTEPERSLILETWNHTETVYDRDQDFAQMIARCHEQAPDSVGVVFEGNHVTYAELNRRANQLAHGLLADGVRPEDLVGISMKRSVEMIIAIWGILKTGAGFLPLDPNFPADRLALMIEDANPPIILTQEALLESLTHYQGGVYCLERNPYPFVEMPVDTPVVDFDIRNMAYVIYTSGSTGKPKGVMIEHHCMTHLLMIERECFTLDSGSRVLVSAQLNFDSAILLITIGMQARAALYIPKKDDLLGDNLAKYLATRRITYALVVPSLLTAVPDVYLPDLQFLGVGGDLCSAEIARKWSEGRLFYNMYGPTEATVVCTQTEVDGSRLPPIGKPIPNIRNYVLDSRARPVPIGVHGELYIAGDGLARGYLDRPDITAERFVPDPFSGVPGDRMYRSGDLTRYLPDGNIEFLGRIDFQVKLRGYRIELGEIEATLNQHPGIAESIVLLREDVPGNQRLVAYCIPTEGAAFDEKAARDHLREKLPEYMVPSAFVGLKAFPLMPNDKINRKALPLPLSPSASRQVDDGVELPNGEVERAIAKVWLEVLGVEEVGLFDNFFDLGGHSLLLAQVYAKIPERFKSRLSMVNLYEYPTVHALAEYIEDSAEYREQKSNEESRPAGGQQEHPGLSKSIAIIGIAGRFPGAENVDVFWRNLCEGKESISFFSNKEMLSDGADPSLLKSPNYVGAKAILTDIKSFDAGFFGYSPRDAQIMDPQQRIFLECAWEGLENAGYTPTKYRGDIGVFAGTGTNRYLTSNLESNSKLLQTMGEYPIKIANDRDFLASRVSYKLNLTGPGVVVQTACSTSLVAIHLAKRALQSGDCDMALAGGVALGDLGKTGYLYKEGMIMSPDGHCRAFDARAQGTVQGQGAGVIVMKRLEDAKADGDHIYAVIRGSAINNDGSFKVGYTAPGAEGQAKVIRAAQESAGVTPDSITYIEAHGTGTPMGDPIEIEGLSRAFREGTNQKGFCAIGSLKTNIGHLDAAAGVASVIKTALSLKHGLIPPSLHYEKPNPRIDFSATPFFVNTALRKWETPDAIPRRAGVSSFGIGGTNAHVILEQAPSTPIEKADERWHLVCFSAKTPSALDAMSDRLVTYLKERPGINLPDAAYTLHVGRRDFKYRRMVVCRDLEEAVVELEENNPRKVYNGAHETANRPIAFMFPGQGSQHIMMGARLYQAEPTFKEHVSWCRAIIKERFPEVYNRMTKRDLWARSERLHQTSVAQPALFIMEYGLGRLLMNWGIKPDAMLGHSVGQYAAACLAGVFSLEDALELVVKRGQLMQSLPPGEMLAVRLSEEEVRPYLSEQLCLAAINGPRGCVVSGTSEAVYELSATLNRQGVQSRVLRTSHAFHSHMMGPIIESFTEIVSNVSLHKPNIPIICNITGTWLTDEDAVDPSYWARQLRREVRFSQGLSELYKHPDRILLEVGPGKVLSTLANQHSDRGTGHKILSTQGFRGERKPDLSCLLTAVGRLWLAGIGIDWEQVHADKPRERMPLPTYPFERKSHWIDSLRKGVGFEGIQDGKDKDFLDDDDPRGLFRSNLDLMYVEPSDLLENKIALVWKRFLDVEEIGVHDDFFELGGDSLVAAQIVGPLREACGPPLAARTILEKRTVAALAEYIRETAQESFRRFSEGLPTVAAGSSKRSVRRGPRRKNENLAEWFYMPTWKRALVQPGERGGVSKKKCWLVFADRGGFGNIVTEHLILAGHQVITVAPGESFHKICDRSYIIHPGRREHYGALLQELEVVDKIPDRLLHFWSLDLGRNMDNPENSSPALCLERGFHSLLYLARSFEALEWESLLEIGVVSNGMQEVVGDDLINPEQATLLGPCRVIPREYPQITCRVIDIQLPTKKSGAWPRLADRLMEEMEVGDPDTTVAFRGRHRWVQQAESVPLESCGERVALLKTGGVYLITGGMGGIGLALAEYLAKHYQARLVLTRRSIFPKKDAWSHWLNTHEPTDEIGVAIKRLQQIERLGGKVFVVPADVTDIDQMEVVVNMAKRTFGAIQGVFHVAGLPAGGVINEISPDTTAKVMAPKFQGTLVLEQVFRSVPLDFMVLFSSSSVFLGNRGYVDYCSANAFLDAFAHYQSARTEYPTISINWDGWSDVGMVMKADVSPEQDSRLKIQLEQAMTAREGMEALHRILGRCSSPQVIVSPLDFIGMLDDIRDLSRITAMPLHQVNDGGADAVGADDRAMVDDGITFNPLERTVANIWKMFLGLDVIGLDEDYFELGGDSLIAAQLVALLSKEVGVNVTTTMLLKTPTVGRLAKSIQNLKEKGVKAGDEKSSPLVEIQTGESGRPPVFLIHPVGGEVYIYRDLAVALGEEQPVFAFQAQSLAGEREPYQDLTEMAGDYLDEMKRLHPSGPYILGGSSYGGMVAVEMARQLVERGAAPALVVLIDTPGPGYMPERLTDQAQMIYYLMGDKLGLTLEELRALSSERQTALVLERAEKVGLSGSLPPHFGDGLFKTWMAHQEAMFHYTPQPYNGDVVFFHPREGMEMNPLNMHRSWTDLVKGRFTVHQVSGNHITMNFSPNVAEIAAKLKPALMDLERKLEKARS